MRIAVIENSHIINIVAGELDIVASIFQEVKPETETSGVAWIGAKVYDDKFQPIPPYSNWVWDEANWTYLPPKEKPEGDFYWDEKSNEWLQEPVVIQVDEELDTSASNLEQGPKA